MFPSAPRQTPDHGIPNALRHVVLRTLEDLRRLVPASTAWEAGESGAALEIRAPDGLPLAGETDVEGLFLATAWGSDELLLAPAAARLVADLVTGREPPIPAAPFVPGRYGL